LTAIPRHSHLAGIIPVANLKTDFDMDVPAIMMPVDAGYTAIQKAVFECAIAGCQTIWIVANDDLAPIVRKRVGEWVYDPVYYSRKFTKFYQGVRKEIPIYYVPIHPKDRDRRDSYGWGVLYGVLAAWKVAYKISKWLLPDKYYITFPMSAYNIYNLREYRIQISNMKENFFLTHNGKTVKDNIPLAFTMFGDDFKACRRAVNKKTSRTFVNPPPGEMPSEKLPIEERWSARHFDFKDVFGEVEEKNAVRLEMDWFYDLSKWREYCEFLGSENNIKKPEEGLTQTHKHSKIAYEVEK